MCVENVQNCRNGLHYLFYQRNVFGSVELQNSYLVNFCLLPREVLATLLCSLAFHGLEGFKTNLIHELEQIDYCILIIRMFHH